MATTASLHKNRTTTLGRIQNFAKTQYTDPGDSGYPFRDVNLASRIYSVYDPIPNITVWRLPGLSGAWKEWTFDQIIQQDFQPTSIGQTFGPLWATYWFKLEFTIQDEWQGKEVHLRWYTGSEATLWSNTGQVLQGFTPQFREEYLITKSWVPSPNPLIYYVEMACSNMFGSGVSITWSDISPPKEDREYTLEKCDIGVFDRAVYKLMIDFDILNGMATEMPDDHKGYQAMFAANEMVNLVVTNESEKASEIADVFLQDKNGDKAHTLYAMGHCHIDTAWLWPYDETLRKCARSFSSQLRLMEEYPDFVFVCSQMQQLEWMQEWLDVYPALYTQLKQKVALGNFVPVGGAWVELDGNVPSGESFVRQFFYGQRFSQREFGIKSSIFWLPDTFGYSAQIPQIMKHVRIDKFLTQKMSWSILNKFPNHNFWWEGIDGTAVLVHFPPGNSYGMSGQVREMLFSVSNSEDKGRANCGIYLYGIGDGGGGPTRTFIERINRCGDVDGLPKMIKGNPDLFFDELNKEGGKLCKWAGELYLELHNGTYTTQAKIKWYNRKGELLFREVELMMTIAYVNGRVLEGTLRNDMLIVDRCWKNFLLNQFHDVLPGSCIQMVAEDAWRLYEELFTDLMTLRSRYNGYNLSNGILNSIIYNPINWDVQAVVFIKRDPGQGTDPSGPNVQRVILENEEFEEQVQGRYRVPNEFSAALVNMRASGYSTFIPQVPTNPVTYSTGSFSNGLVRFTVPTQGVPYEEIYFTGSKTGKEYKVFGDRLGTGTRGGMFYIYDDVPLYWDAWDVMDYHLETRQLPAFVQQGQFESISQGPIVGCYRWRFTFGSEVEKSSITRYTIIRANSPMIEYYAVVDWKENRKMLKVEFPVDVFSREATYEIQYVHVKRPTTMNTSWDVAKFEVCGHKWMDISQSDRGVTIITDSKYGWSVRDNIIKLSMLKSPKNPDKFSDIHKHFIYYAVLPHEGSFQESEVIKRAYELNFFGANNVPLLSSDFAGAQLPANWVTVNDPSVVVSCFKVGHDTPKTVCVRLYESHGGSPIVRISLGFPIVKVEICDGLEEPGETVPTSGNSFETTFHPFEIKSFLVSF